MKVLNQSSTETLVFRLINTLPDFLFIATSKVSDKKVYFISADVSLSTEYSKFLIKEGLALSSPLVGEVELRPSGFWKFEIYEQTSTTNLNPAGLNLIWTEQVKVIKDELKQPESGT